MVDIERGQLADSKPYIWQTDTPVVCKYILTESVSVKPVNPKIHNYDTKTVNGFAKVELTNPFFC